MTVAEKPSRSTARAPPAGTWRASADRITSEPRRRISACSRPTALCVVVRAERVGADQLGELAGLVGGGRACGRISCRTTGTPACASCQAASEPANPPPITWITCFCRAVMAQYLGDGISVTTAIGSRRRGWRHVVSAGPVGNCGGRRCSAAGRRPRQGQADGGHERHVRRGGNVAADSGAHDGLLWLCLPAPHGTDFYRQGARHANGHSCQGAGLARRRAQSHSAGLRLVRSPGRQGNRHLTARRERGYPGFDDAHNFDCWDTTATTLACCWYSGMGRVTPPHRWRSALSGQYPGRSVAPQHRRYGGTRERNKWIVDMWTTAYGQPPDVMPLAQWLTEK